MLCLFYVRNIKEKRCKMKKKIRERSLRLESLEDRMLLAVTAGGGEAVSEYAAPAETGAEIVCDVTFNALRQAINKASAGDTIIFNGSGTIDVTSALNLNKNITINGGGNVTLRGGGSNMLLNITSSCALTGLNLEGGYATATGRGGVGQIANGISVVLSDCKIANNSVDNDNADSGGAFYVLGTLTLNNCDVYGNSAANGGFAYLYGRDNHGAATIDATNCNFYGNTADEGAVIKNQGGTIYLTNCSVVANSAADGAIANYSWFTCHSRTDGSTSTDGQSSNYYHRYYISDTTITNSIFAYNTATDNATADLFERYDRDLYGNGVREWETFNVDDTYTKVECTNSIMGLAGDYFVEAPRFNEDGSIANLETLDLTIKSDSIAAYAGIGANPTEYTGAGYTDASLVVTTLGDVADAADGVVSLREALAYATLGTFDETPIITFADELSGGTILLSSGQLVIISDVNIEGGNVTVNADGQSRVLYLKSYTYQMDMEGNYYDYTTTPVCPQHNSADYNINVSIDGLNFTGGAAELFAPSTGGAGILAQQNVNLSLSNSTVFGNTLSATVNTYRNTATPYTTTGGGGIAATLYSTVTLDNVSVVNNRLIQTGERSIDIILQGGGIYVGARSVLSMNKSAVSGNTLSAEEYINNHTQWGFGYGYGAGICVSGTAEILSSSISGNTTVGCGYYQSGGGVYHYLSNEMLGATGKAYGLVIANTAITGNTLGDSDVENNGFCQGGGIYNAGKALLVNDLVEGNSFDAGNTTTNMTGYINGPGLYNGAVYDYFSRAICDAVMDIYYCTITNNTAACVNFDDFDSASSTWGGGIYNAYNRGVAATVNLTGSILYHNYSKNSTSGTTTNNDSYNAEGSVFNMVNTLYNNSGTKGSGYNYDSCVRWLAMYKVFNDEAGGDYTPWAGTRPSQALDALSESAPTPPDAYISAYDVRNEPYVRVYGSAQDLGCYETQPEPSPTFQVTITDYTGDYDGQAHTVSLSGLEAGDVVTYSADGETYSADVVAYTDPGTYTVYVKVARDGYQDFNGSGTVTINGAAPVVPLAAPTITTGANRIYVSYGANRHLIQWSAVENASGYEVAYTDGGTAWTLVSVEEGTSAVIRGLTYGLNVDYKVRALGDGTSYSDSDWSAVKTFNVCPMDINNDTDISGGDRTLLAQCWLSEEGEEGYEYYADINGDGDVGGADRAYLSNNWLLNVEDDADDLQYPPAKRADAFFAEFASADLDADLGVF